MLVDGLGDVLGDVEDSALGDSVGDGVGDGDTVSDAVDVGAGVGDEVVVGAGVGDGVGVRPSDGVGLAGALLSDGAGVGGVLVGDVPGLVAGDVGLTVPVGDSVGADEVEDVGAGARVAGGAAPRICVISSLKPSSWSVISVREYAVMLRAKSSSRVHTPASWSSCSSPGSPGMDRTSWLATAAVMQEWQS